MAAPGSGRASYRFKLASLGEAKCPLWVIRDIRLLLGCPLCTNRDCTRDPYFSDLHTRKLVSMFKT